MTHIITEEFPKENFKLVKKSIQRGDKVIFQFQENGSPMEAEVVITDVKDQPGLMKGWRVISWENA